MIQEFTKENLRNVVRPAVQNALDEVSKKLGVTLTLGNISFSKFEFKARVESKVIQSKEENDLADKNVFETNCIYFGLKPSDFDRHFIGLNNEEYKIAGLYLRSRKYPIVAVKISDGQRFKFTDKYVKSKIG